MENLDYLLAVYKDSESGNLSAWKVGKEEAKILVPEEIRGRELEQMLQAKKIL